MLDDEPLLSLRQRTLLYTAAVGASIPSIVLSGWLLIGPASRWSPWFGVAVAVAWIGSGPVVEYRGWRADVSYLKAHAVMAAADTPIATARVRKAWKYVALGAGVPPSTCTIQVVGGDDFYASLLGDRYIRVSWHTVRVLSERQLEAVVAHEFGHHLQRAAVPTSLLWWYGRLFVTIVHYAYLPSARLVRRFVADPDEQREVRWAVAGIAAWLAASATLLAGLWLLLGPWAALLALVGVPWQTVLGRYYAWSREYHADRVAVDLGYARHLSEALTIAELACEPSAADELRPTWIRTHPTHERRLAAIDSAHRRWTDR